MAQIKNKRIFKIEGKIFNMKYIKCDYKEYIKKDHNFDYYIIDPPWNYLSKPPGLFKNQLIYSLWDDNNNNDQLAGYYPLYTSLQTAVYIFMSNICKSS